MKSIKVGFQSEIIKEYKKIKNGSREDKELFIVEGMWAFEKLMKTPVQILSLISCKDNITSKKERDILSELEKKASRSYEISSKTMNRLNSKDNSNIMMICRLKPHHTTLNRVMILDGLENPGNIGTIFRSADGAGIDAILIVNEKAKVNQYKIVKASMGGYFNAPWYHFDSIKSCMDFIKENQLELYLANPSTSDLSSVKNSFALVVGNERYGLSKEWFHYDHQCLSIPMLGCCDSLNVGVAASILMYKIGVQ